MQTWPARAAGTRAFFFQWTRTALAGNRGVVRVAVVVDVAAVSVPPQPTRTSGLARATAAATTTTRLRVMTRFLAQFTPRSQAGACPELSVRALEAEERERRRLVQLRLVAPARAPAHPVAATHLGALRARDGDDDAIPMPRCLCCFTPAPHALSLRPAAGFCPSPSARHPATCGLPRWSDSPAEGPLKRMAGRARRQPLAPQENRCPSSLTTVLTVSARGQTSGRRIASN